MMKKTLPLLVAGLLAAGGAMAQSAGSAGAGDSAMSAQPNPPSQSLNDNSPPSNLPGSSGTGLSSDTNTMGAGPSTTVVVPVTPVAVVPVAVVPVDQPRFGRGSVAYGGAQEGGGATLESNGGPYDSAWWGPRGTYVYVPR